MLAVVPHTFNQSYTSMVLESLIASHCRKLQTIHYEFLKTKRKKTFYAVYSMNNQNSYKQLQYVVV